MNCCINCFKDLEIREIIKEQNQIGDCDFCNQKKTYITNIEENDDIKSNFESLIDIYSSEKEKPDLFPIDRMDLLKNILAYRWNIFNLKPDTIYKFLTALLPEKYTAQPELFDSPVGIFESMNEDYLQQYSILGKYQWEDFVTEIKEKNRFHTNIINKEILLKVLQLSSKIYKKGAIFYRARICQSRGGYHKNNMGAPVFTIM